MINIILIETKDNKGKINEFIGGSAADILWIKKVSHVSGFRFLVTLVCVYYCFRFDKPVQYI